MTGVRPNNSNPIFNEVAVFKVSSRDLNSVSIKVVVYELFNETIESVVGSVLIGPQKKTLKDNNISHWQQMLRLLRRSVF